MRPVTSSWERAGFVIATAEEGPEAAGRLAERAAALIDIATEPGSEAAPGEAG
ncbi:hypothetical protein ABZX97_27765 [Streptomyces seoulensis]|uniref:hypothetical protein n=1 Tax=Streptomyces seoulensis TaxID=73044 RepID=UPI0033BAFCB0